MAAQELGPLADFVLWDKAFHVFMSILVKNPKGTGVALLDNLLIYRRSIQMMYRAGGDWEAYDIKFRRALSYLPNQVKWYKRQCDLWDDCMRRGRQAGQRKGGAPGPSKGKEDPNSGAKFFQGRRTNYCYRFQNKNKCDNTNCKFSHRCNKCDSTEHGAIGCTGADKAAVGGASVSK